MLTILLIPLATALEECQREQDPSEIPCIIISSWHPGTCGDYNASIYNGSGDIIQTKDWEDYPPTCSLNFNITKFGTYYYNSSVEDGVINVKSEDKMWLLGLLLIPLALCFFFVYFSNQLEDTHNPLKWFFRLIALIMIFVVYQGAHIIIGLNENYSAMEGMFNIALYGWIFWTIMAYMLIYLIYNIFMSFKHNRRWDYNRKWLR